VRKKWCPSTGAAYAAIARRAGDRCFVFARTGTFVEFYGPQRLVAQRVLGLRPVRHPRGPFGLSAGFPARLAGRLRRRALAADWRVIDVRGLRSQTRDRGSRVCAERIWISVDAPSACRSANSASIVSRMARAI
jgi:hypothetical protein